MMRSSEQRQLGEAVRELAAKYASTVRDAYEVSAGYDPATWAEIGRMGLAGIAVCGAHGGAGGTNVDLAVALEELGRDLIPSPLFQTAALTAPLLAACESHPTSDRWLTQIAAGEIQATVATIGELTLDSDGLLDGSLPRVIGGATADLVLVLARTASGSRVFGVEAPADGLVTEECTPLDPTRPIASLHFHRVPATPLQGDQDTVRRARTVSRALLAAEQVGGAQRCLEMAVDYAKVRVQFGAPIGSFQAIKHICADLYTAVECARALTYDALGTGGARETSMAGAFASEAFVTAAEKNMQVHGGISYTWEHDCHLLLKRALASARLITSPREDYAAVLS